MSFPGNRPKSSAISLIPQSTDPVSPAEGDLQYADGAVRAEGLWVYTNGAWQPVGSGAGVIKNYLGSVNGADNNGNFESGSVSNWVLGNATLTNAFPSGAPTFGSGAAAQLTRTITTTNPLAGSFSLQYASSVATTAGNFLASPAFTIDREDRAKVLSFSFSYEVVSGTINASGTSANSFGVAIYDVTNSVWVQPAGVYNIVQSSGVGLATGTFQTAANASQFRFVLFNATATSGAVTLNVDDFVVGPQPVVNAPAVSDWQSYTPTWAGFGTPTNVEAFWRRVGANAEIRLKWVNGTVTATEARAGLPPGLTSAASAVIPTIQLAGGSIRSSNAATYFAQYPLIEPSVTYLTFGVQTSTANPVAKALGTAFANGDTMEVLAFVPIAGWSSNSVSSADTDTRAVSFNGSNASIAMTANVTNLTLSSVKDSHASWSTSQYLVPISGDYVVAGACVGSAATGLYAYVNGTIVTGAAVCSVPAAAQSGGGSILLPNLRAGDSITFRVTTTATLSSVNLSIFRLSGPAVITATESVNAFYSTAAAPSIPNATNTTVTFGTRVFDTHNAMSGSTYTVPVTGKYRVSGSLYYSGTTATSTDVQFNVLRNGVLQFGVNNPKSGTVGTPIAVSASGLVSCNAGDTITIQAFQATGVALTLINNGSYNWVAIERVGN